MVLHQEQLMTADTFWELSQSDDRHWELIQGVIHEMAPTGWLHGNVTDELAWQMGSYVREHQLGRLTAAETGYRLNEKTVLAPDIGFIRAERMPDAIPEGFVPLAPDLAVEVMSPGNSAPEMSKKIRLFVQHGTRLVWIVHPDSKTVDVYEAADGEARVTFLSVADVLTGGDVLPGFELPVRSIFGGEDDAADE